jgi:hypothetical protein
MNTDHRFDNGDDVDVEEGAAVRTEAAVRGTAAH